MCFPCTGLRIVLYTVGVLAGAALGTAGCTGGDKAPSAALDPPLVEVARVARTTIEQKRTFTGYAHPWEARGVGFLVAGRVTSIDVEEGDRVEKGQLLATLDPADYELVKRLAEIQVEAVAPNFERVEDLVEARAVPKARLDEIRGKYRAALTQRLQAKRQFEYTRLTAPTSGVVMERKTSVGQVIGPGMPAVVLLDVSRLKVKFGITQSDLGSFEEGMSVTLDFPGVDGKVHGKVRHVGVVPDPKTRTYEVAVEVDNGDGRLRPGMLAHLELVVGTLEGIFVPLSAVKNGSGGEGELYVVEPGTGLVGSRKVRLGRRVRDEVEVVSGLEVGESLIVAGQGFVSPGDEVRTE